MRDSLEIRFSAQFRVCLVWRIKMNGMKWFMMGCPCILLNGRNEMILNVFMHPWMMQHFFFDRTLKCCIILFSKFGYTARNDDEAICVCTPRDGSPLFSTREGNERWPVGFSNSKTWRRDSRKMAESSPQWQGRRSPCGQIRQERGMVKQRTGGYGGNSFVQNAYFL